MFMLMEASQIDFVHEKRHMDVLLETPHPPPFEMSCTLLSKYFTIYVIATLSVSRVAITYILFTWVHNTIIGINIFHDFSPKNVKAPPPPPPPPLNVHMTFLVDKIDMWCFPNTSRNANWFASIR